MIKILFFIDKFAYQGSIGGAERVLITLVNHMDPSKFDITVQTLFPDEYASLLNSKSFVLRLSWGGCTLYISKMIMILR